jgi:hypothetical protein
MNYRTLGRTGLSVSELGFGAWEIGWTRPEEGDDIGRLLNRALDSGINFIDSSAAYRWSEELIAKYVGHRRDEFYFATKCGSWRVLQSDGEWVQTLDYSAKAGKGTIRQYIGRRRCRSEGDRDGCVRVEGSGRAGRCLLCWLPNLVASWCTMAGQKGSYFGSKGLSNEGDVPVASISSDQIK